MTKGAGSICHLNEGCAIKRPVAGQSAALSAPATPAIPELYAQFLLNTMFEWSVSCRQPFANTVANFIEKRTTRWMLEK